MADSREHAPVNNAWQPGVTDLICGECLQAWPCETIRLREESERLRSATHADCLELAALVLERHRPARISKSLYRDSEIGRNVVDVCWQCRGVPEWPCPEAKAAQRVLAGHQGEQHV